MLQLLELAVLIVAVWGGRRIPGLSHGVCRQRQPSGPTSSNDCGYRLLRSGRTADALKLFKANVDLYPADANAYESLGEGQMMQD